MSLIERHILKWPWGASGDNLELRTKNQQTTNVLHQKKLTIILTHYPMDLG